MFYMKLHVKQSFFFYHFQPCQRASKPEFLHIPPLYLIKARKI